MEKRVIRKPSTLSISNITFGGPSRHSHLEAKANESRVSTKTEKQQYIPDFTDDILPEEVYERFGYDSNVVANPNHIMR